MVHHDGKTDRSIAGKWLACALWLLPFILVWGRLSLPTHALGFRDAAFYYPPLLRLVTESWHSGKVPLWTPYEEAGRPLLADPTSLSLYPGLFVFVLPIS
ncbi:MAG: hypothetical protein KDB23_32055, partial [Planctomycetales bacterium]|nr:hypothetical protein [Planctomycetales bacterium]